MAGSGSAFAARLKSLREAAGITQQELATRAGMHKLGVAKLEQGLREPTWATVQALAKALGVTVLGFVVEDGEAEMRPAQMGRPRKAPAAAQETPAASKATPRHRRGKRSPPRASGGGGRARGADLKQDRGRQHKENKP